MEAPGFRLFFQKVVVGDGGNVAGGAQRSTGQNSRSGRLRKVFGGLFDLLNDSNPMQFPKRHANSIDMGLPISPCPKIPWGRFYHGLSGRLSSGPIAYVFLTSSRLFSA